MPLGDRTNTGPGHVPPLEEHLHVIRSLLEKSFVQCKGEGQSSTKSRSCACGANPPCVVRAKEVFGVQRAVVVSQRFHNLRALTLARTLGLDWVGFCASDPAATPWMRRWTRESAARIRMIGDILLLFLSRS